MTWRGGAPKGPKKKKKQQTRGWRKTFGKMQTLGAHGHLVGEKLPLNVTNPPEPAPTNFGAMGLRQGGLLLRGTKKHTFTGGKGRHMLK